MVILSIIKNLPILVQIKPVIAKLRLCQLINVHFSILIKEDPSLFKTLFSYITSCVILYHENQAVATEAISAINSIISLGKFIKGVTNYLDPIMSHLIGYIEKIEVPIFFDFLFDVILNTNVLNHIPNLISALVKRVEKETKRKFNVIKKNRMGISSESEKLSYINKCFNVIKAISDSPEYVSNLPVFNINIRITSHKA